MPKRRPPPRAGRTIWGVLGFLALFVVLLVVVSHYYLLPALSAAPHVSPAWRRKLSADALLICCLLLFILFSGLLLTVRPGRFFFPAKTERRKPTRYVDAWAEAGRRLENEPDEPVEDDDTDDA